MKLAILFWFYKDTEICVDRLRLLRVHNPDTPIFGLYGGDREQTSHFQAQLSPYLDDFYEYSLPKSRDWKWINGDLMIAQWYRDRGRHLSWDTIFIAQWDMLLFESVAELFSELNKGEILLGGARPIAEVEEWWNWTLYERPGYLEFLDHVRREYDYADAPVCAQFVVVCLPRQFLRRYIEVNKPELGFIEYRIPIYAQIFGVPFCYSTRFANWWAAEPRPYKTPWREVALTAEKYEIPFSTVRANLMNPHGARLFHPCNEILPLDPERISELINVESAPRMPKRAVLVLGPLTSGTRGIAAALAALGVDFGDERQVLDMGIYEDEWHPTYELSWITRLNDEILADLERAGGSMAASLLDPARLREYESRIYDAVREEWGADNIRLIGIMDPRLIPLFPVWKSALSKLGYDVRAIIMSDTVGLSAPKKQPAANWSDERLARDWLRYITIQFFFAKDCKARIVDLQRLRSAPAVIVDELCRWLEFQAMNVNALAGTVEGWLGRDAAKGNEMVSESFSEGCDAQTVPMGSQTTKELLEMFYELCADVCFPSPGSPEWLVLGINSEA